MYTVRMRLCRSVAVLYSEHGVGQSATCDACYVMSARPGLCTRSLRTKLRRKFNKDVTLGELAPAAQALHR